MSDIDSVEYNDMSDNESVSSSEEDKYFIENNDADSDNSDEESSMEEDENKLPDITLDSNDDHDMDDNYESGTWRKYAE